MSELAELAIAVGRSDKQQVARERQCGGLVLAIRIRKKYRGAARIEPKKLLLLVTAGVARIDQRVGRLGPVHAETHRLREIGELPRFVAGSGDTMELHDIAGTSRNDQLAFSRMPAYGGRRLELGIRSDLGGQRRSDGWNIFGL